MATDANMILFGNAQSSCTGRVRIALNLKNIRYEKKPVNVKTSQEYADLNPQRLVPLLVTKDARLSQR